MDGWKRASRAALGLYPRGLKLFWLAPAVPALVMVPEFVQHVAEVSLGMFDSRDTFRALADDPTRMAFGFVKVAGLTLAMLAAARFWWVRGHGGRWYDLRQVAWGRLGIGLFLSMLVPAAPLLVEERIGQPAAEAASIALSLALLPALFLMLAGLFGDRTTPARAMWRRSWPWALLTVLLAAAGFVPAQWLHQMNHQWAFGAPIELVWALMIFDSLLVGLMAGLLGTAFYLGYAAFARRGAE